MTAPPTADLRDATRRLASAYRSALLWADRVRQAAEKRAGCDPLDKAAADDPEYAAALAWCTALDDLRVGAGTVLANAPKES